jgi:hypothetical protein
MKPVIVFLVAIFLLPFVLSFDCDLVDKSNYCEDVQSSSISEIEKEQVYASLLYVTPIKPDHSFIQDYNKKVDVNSPPHNTPIHNSKYIRNAWLSFSALSPSVYVDGILFVPTLTQALSHYNYYVQLPSNYNANDYPQNSNGDCKRINLLKSNDASVTYLVNGKGNPSSSLLINSDGKVTAKLTIAATVKQDHFHWKEYKFLWWTYYKCEYSHTSFDSDQVVIKENKDVRLYDQQPQIDIEVLATYKGTTKLKGSGKDFSFVRLSLPESYIEHQEFSYSVVFEKHPYYMVYLKAHPTDYTKAFNMYADEDIFHVKNIDSCQIEAYNHFYSIEKECLIEEKELELEPLEIKEKDLDLSILLYIMTFLLLLYLIYKLLKSQFKKIIIPLLLILLLLPFVAADSGESECGLTNLGSCIVEKMLDAVMIILNAPLIPLLWLIQNLLTADVGISIFHHIWLIVKYMISFFYIFFILYAGYVFLTSSANPIKRAHAKDVLKNLIIIVVLVQGSYYIYDLLINIGSNMSSYLIGMIDPEFFLLTADNITNVGLQFLFALWYGFTLFTTVLFLVFRYIVVAIGVIFFPIGIFCYFIPPLKGYGKFIINMHVIMIFIAFFDLLIIWACSLLLNVEVFQNFKILVMIACFSLVNYSLWLATKFAIKRSTNTSIKDDLNQAAKYIAMLV